MLVGRDDCQAGILNSQFTATWPLRHGGVVFLQGPQRNLPKESGSAEIVARRSLICQLWLV